MMTFSVDNITVGCCYLVLKFVISVAITKVGGPEIIHLRTQTEFGGVEAS